MGGDVLTPHQSFPRWVMKQNRCQRDIIMNICFSFKNIVKSDNFKSCGKKKYEINWKNQRGIHHGIKKKRQSESTRSARYPVR